jgi:hypothetical protein
VQGGRPADEHRFQVKYGSEFDRNTLFIDPSRRKVTLMFEVHLEDFIAVDPRMHTPTWFSALSVQTENLEEAEKGTGTAGSANVRMLVARSTGRNLQTETVIGLRPDQFPRYVEFERVASGLECGERLLLSDRIERSLTSEKLSCRA